MIEDDRNVSTVTAAYLRSAGYTVEVVEDGAKALERFRRLRPDLVLLDVLLPGRDGWSILEDIRAESACPVIMLTALNELDQRVDGLVKGADDYISKPFNNKEVVARVQAVLRRQPVVVSDDRVAYGPLLIDFGAQTIYCNGELVSLRPRDRALFLFLARHPNQILARATLIDRVWGMDYDGSDRAVDLAIKRIRESLPPVAYECLQIVTHRGIGYQLCVASKV